MSREQHRRAASRQRPLTSFHIPTKWTPVALVALVAIGAMLMAACASTAPRPIAVVPGSDLPPGLGRTMLESSCTVCHDLREVTKFRGYYNRQQWQDIVATMMGYGANIKKDDVDLLADYLTQNLGRK
jgi:hypothetical protein